MSPPTASRASLASPSTLLSSSVTLSTSSSPRPLVTGSTRATPSALSSRSRAPPTSTPPSSARLPAPTSSLRRSPPPSTRSLRTTPTVAAGSFASSSTRRALARLMSSWMPRPTRPSLPSKATSPTKKNSILLFDLTRQSNLDSSAV